MTNTLNSESAVIDERPFAPAMPGGINPSGEQDLEFLPEIPSLEDLASDPMTRRFGQPFNPPGVNNEWGHAQVNETATGLMALTFPPFASGGLPVSEWSQGHVTTCELILNDKLVAAWPDAETTFQWFPHAVTRVTTVDGLRLDVRTFLPRLQKAVAQEITITNESGEDRDVCLVFVLRAHVVKRDEEWGAFVPADKADVGATRQADGCIVFSSQSSRAFSVQGFDPAPDEILNNRSAHFLRRLPAGDSFTMHFANILGEDESVAIHEYREALRNFDALWIEAGKETQRRIEAAFTPGNSVYSGSLPRLRTRNRALWRIYFCSFTNYLFNRVESPWAALTPTYVTLRPRLASAMVYAWDLGLVALSASLLDPEIVRRYIEVWVVEFLDKYFAVNYVTGKGVTPGDWYAANPWAILRCADYYLRVNGDLAWLDKKLDGRPIIDHLECHAVRWKELDRRGVGLADYGSAANLLEVVSTYSHEVASFNAGSVYGMRFVARLRRLRNEDEQAARLEADASALAVRILEKLYVPGKGYWRCGQPDGSTVEVRHCLDFFTTMEFLHEDMPEAVRSEMIAFFWRELATKAWMHALSPGDIDSTVNGRADHSWSGAYSGWPAHCARVLLQCGDDPSRAAEWIQGLALSANQGPFGQSHVVETSFDPVHGGARKWPTRQTYGDLQDWSMIAGAGFIDTILEGVFGIGLELEGPPKVASCLAAFDPLACVSDFRIRGGHFDFTL